MYTLATFSRQVDATYTCHIHVMFVYSTRPGFPAGYPDRIFLFIHVQVVLQYSQYYIATN